ncbi:MAG: hypothetical protein ACOX2M_03005 [Fastidiosipilaceae bacterium]
MIKILLISNNPFSRTEHNGKTLASFFQGWSDVAVSQLFFRPEKPDGTGADGVDVAVGYYQVTDGDALHGRAGRSFAPGGTDFAQDVDQTSLTARAPNTPTSGIYKASWRSWSLTRILRERVWKHYPFMEKNQSWLKEMEDWRPDLIFFCAGDSLFAYDVVEDLHERLDCKLIMYVTDDYILPYRSLSPFYVLRRGQIRERMLSCGRAADAVFTIGQKMRDTYEREYGLTSRCLVNMSPDHQTPYKVAHQSGERPLRLIYAGGLHYDRDLVLRRAADAIAIVNQEHEKSLFELDIFAPRTLSERRLRRLNSEFSHFHGPVGPDELEAKLKDADILLFVESANRSAIRSTRLSLSTKVPEYLSYNRCVLSIGDQRSSSIHYLSDYSLTAQDNVRSIAGVLRAVAARPKLLEETATVGYSRFRSHHAPEKLREAFREALLSALSSTDRQV